MLSELALRSKAHWGYDAAFLDACRDELTVAVADIEQGRVAVLEEGGLLRGFYLLRQEVGDDETPNEATPAAELELLYIDPDALRRGYGRRLWEHAVATARRRACECIVIHSDPYATGFYAAVGARIVGETPSGSIEGRMLPLLRFDMREGREDP